MGPTPPFRRARVRDAALVALELLVPAGVRRRRGHRSWGRPRGGGRSRAQPREERASSAAASCAGERAGGDGTTPRPCPPCGAPPLVSTAVTRIELNCSHPNRCSSTPRRSKPAATQIEFGHAAPPPLASRPTADHESAATGVRDGRSTPSMEPPPPPHRSCRPLPAAGRSEGGGEEAPRPRQEERHCAAPEPPSRRSATSPPPPFDPRGAMAPPLPNGGSSGGVSIDGERWRRADAREAGLRRGGLSIFPSEGRLEQEEPPLPLPLYLNGPQTPSYGVVDVSVTARSASWQLLHAGEPDKHPCSWIDGEQLSEDSVIFKLNGPNHIDTIN
ncbi:unnamed protein product [Urochloa humidicola]